MTPRLAWSAIGWLTAASATAATNSLSDGELEGRNIVLHLLSQRPTENFTNTGTLHIRGAKRARAEVPVELQTIVTPTNWLANYSAHGTNTNHTAVLTVVHTDLQPNVYRLARIAPHATNVTEFITLSGAEAMIPFAGSDFWLADLGLEFLHWPQQRLLRKELKRSQSCYVIESQNPASTSGYVRVVSWMDIDSVRDAGQAAIVQAEAYDAKGKVVKQFEPKDIMKVNGQWQLKAMEMRDARTGSRSRIEFKTDAK